MPYFIYLLDFFSKKKKFLQEAAGAIWCKKGAIQKTLEYSYENIKNRFNRSRVTLSTYTLFVVFPPKLSITPKSFS